MFRALAARAVAAGLALQPYGLLACVPSSGTRRPVRSGALFQYVDRPHRGWPQLQVVLVDTVQSIW